MSENVLESSAEAPSLQQPRAFDTIVYGGLVVGILDMLFAFTFYGLILGAPPLRIFQSVAAGLLGRAAAYEGGVKTFVLGILLHFVVATCIATVYFLASRVLPVLIRHPIASQRIDIRHDRLPRDEISRRSPFSHRAKRKPAAAADLPDRNFRTRFPGRVAARAAGASIREKE